jgi:hypothetical protein
LGFFDSPNNVKGGFNLLNFENGIEVPRKNNTSKSYVMGYIPLIKRKNNKDSLFLENKNTAHGVMHVIATKDHKKYTGSLMYITQFR